MQLRICAQDNGRRTIARPMLLWRCECQLIKEDARPQPVWSSGLLTDEPRALRASARAALTQEEEQRNGASGAMKG